MTMRSKKAAIRGGLVVAAMAATAFTVGTGVANATAGKYCGTFGSGYTIDTIWTKKPPGCHDLNVVNSDSFIGGDYYAGFYRSSNGQWHEGSKGYVWLADGSHNPNTNTNAVLLTDVLAGTPMYIGANTYPDYVEINY